LKAKFNSAHEINISNTKAKKLHTKPFSYVSIYTPQFLHVMSLYKMFQNTD